MAYQSGLQSARLAQVYLAYVRLSPITYVLFSAALNSCSYLIAHSLTRALTWTDSLDTRYNTACSVQPNAHNSSHTITWACVAQHALWLGHASLTPRSGSGAHRSPRAITQTRIVKPMLSRSRASKNRRRCNRAAGRRFCLYSIFRARH